MKFFTLLAICLMALSSQARMEFGVAAGYRSNQADTDLVNASVSSKSGLQVGPVAYFSIGDNWGLRSGFLYTQRFVTVEHTKQGDVDVQYAYFDVPVTGMIRFADFAGIFGGPIFGFNQSRDVSCTVSSGPNCAAADVKSIIVPWQIGINFRMLSQFGADLYYEYVPGDLSANVSDMRTVGANLIFYFE